MSTDVASPSPRQPAPPSPTPPSRAARSSSALGRYQPGLDGIRGVAMLVILGYHDELPWTRGAFLALSQFFTLSGFLITGVLLRNHVGPGRGLRSFWTRRARRLFPAAFLALTLVVVFGATVATRQQAQDLPGQVAAAATWTANWFFVITNRSYIDLFSAPSPVQHFWSLAIEEQFYLVLPLALIFIVRKTRSPYVLGGVLGGAALLSTAWMIYLYNTGASLDRLYYGTDTRIAEFLVGAALAVVITRIGTSWSERTRWTLGVAGMLAFAATVWCWVVIPLADGVIWQGGFLVFAILSCTVILGVLSGRGSLGPLLSLPPLPWIGRLSYGLYLFHWPVFLWLTEARTGLDRWPLLALRLLVTFTLATLSYYYVERPILRGASLGLRGRVRFAVLPVAAVVVVLVTVVTVNRSGDDPLETLRAGASSAEMPRESSDGVLNLLVIPARPDDPVVNRLSSKRDHAGSVDVTVADPFQCSGGLVAVKSGRTCASWAQTWPELIRRKNPDAVILFIDGWAGDDLGRLTGLPPADQAAGAAKILAPGFDLLSARGAPIIWAVAGSDFTHPLRFFNSPLNQAMLTLEAQRSDIFKVIGLPNPGTTTREAYVSQSSAKLLSDASLHQRTKDAGLPRVMIVGDSQSLSLGYGLDRWAAENKRALVWNRGIEGCGVAVDGEVRAFGATSSSLERCREVERSWPRQIKAFHPDVVVVFSSLTDIQDRKLRGTSEYLSIGDPKFDEFLVKEYENAVKTLSASGARVVWMTPPCVGRQAEAGATPYDTKHIEHLDSAILPKLERRQSGRVTAFDLAAVVCPRGEPLSSVDGVDDLRPDGIHFSVDGSLWFAEHYGEKLLAAGGL